MYIFIRIIILAVVIVPVLFVGLNKNSRNKIILKLSNRKIEQIKRCVWALTAVFIVFTLAVIYPFEAPFVKFDTVEQSVNYSMYNFDIIERLNSTVYTAEDDDTVFVVNEHGNTYRYSSLAKFDDGYGYCGHKVSVKIKANIEFVSTKNFDGAADVSAVYNKNTNKTCYVLNLFDSDFADATRDVYDTYGNKLDVFMSLDGEPSDKYYSIQSGVPKEQFVFVLDGKQFVLEL